MFSRSTGVKHERGGAEVAPLPPNRLIFLSELIIITDMDLKQEPVITISDVSFDYRSGDSVSRGVSSVGLTIMRGEFVVLLGRNGSGKSTLAKLLNGFLLPDRGSIEVLGINTADDDKIFELRSKVGMVFQNPDNQMVASIIEDDLAFGPENLGVPADEIRKRVDRALEIVGMTEYALRTPNKLSGGQKQRVAIAAVLAMEPEILILDESTAMLDPKGRGEVLETVRRLNREEGITVILITHYMDEATEADRIVVMDDGRVLQTGAPYQIFSDRALIERAGLELPVATKAAHLLREKGVEIPAVLTDEELTEAVCRLS